MLSTIPLLGSSEFFGQQERLHRLRSLLAELGHNLVEVDAKGPDYLLGLNPKHTRIPFTLSVTNDRQSNSALKTQAEMKFRTRVQIESTVPGIIQELQSKRGVLSNWPAPTLSYQTKNAIRFIWSTLSNPDLCVSKISGHLQLSHDTLQKRFMTEVGMGIWEYVVDQRIEHAKQLLRFTDIRIHELAAAVGYSDQSNFTRAFRAKVGMPPTAFKRCGAERVTTKGPK
jgi:AraC-like DNA-binding protein